MDLEFKRFSPNLDLDIICNISHPQWTDQFQIIGERGWRLSNNDKASILFREKNLVLKWDK